MAERTAKTRPRVRLSDGRKTTAERHGEKHSRDARPRIWSRCVSQNTPRRVAEMHGPEYGRDAQPRIRLRRAAESTAKTRFRGARPRHGRERDRDTAEQLPIDGHGQSWPAGWTTDNRAIEATHR